MYKERGLTEAELYKGALIKLSRAKIKKEISQLFNAAATENNQRKPEERNDLQNWIRDAAEEMTINYFKKQEPDIENAEPEFINSLKDHQFMLTQGFIFGILAAASHDQTGEILRNIRSITDYRDKLIEDIEKDEA